MNVKCAMKKTNDKKKKKSPLLIIFFANGCLKEQRKVLENSLKIYLKSP